MHILPLSFSLSLKFNFNKSSLIGNMASFFECICHIFKIKKSGLTCQLVERQLKGPPALVLSCWFVIQLSPLLPSVIVCDVFGLPVLTNPGLSTLSQHSLIFNHANRLKTQTWMLADIEIVG